MSYGINDLRAKFTTKNEGMSGIANNGVKTKINKKVISSSNTSFKYLTSLRIILTNQNKNDTIRLSIVDKEYLYAGVLYPSDYNGTAWSIIYPDGVELDHFGENWNVVADVSDQGIEDPGYWSQLLNGLYIVFEYDSKGTVDVDFKVNLNMQEEK